MPPYLSGFGTAIDDTGVAEVVGATLAEVAGLGAADGDAGAGAGTLEGGAWVGVGEAVEQDMTKSDARITSIRLKQVTFDCINLSMVQTSRFCIFILFQSGKSNRLV